MTSHEIEHSRAGPAPIGALLAVLAASIVFALAMPWIQSHFVESLTSFMGASAYMLQTTSIECGMIATIVVFIHRAASLHGARAWKWAGFTLLLCLVSLVVPLMFLRVLAVGIAALAALYLVVDGR